MKKRILAILLAVSLLFCAAPQLLPTASAAQSESYRDPLRYGWQALEQMEDAENLLYVYGELVTGLSECRNVISVYDDSHRVTSSQLSSVVEAVRSDYPEFFWMGLGYSMSSMSGYVRTVTPQYTMSADQVASAKAILERNTALLLTGLEDKSDYEISKLIHDRLAAFMSYQYGTNDQTIYGALVERQAVCSGYAAAYQYLMQRAGIPAWKVTGSSIDPADGSPKGHAWTLVCLDGSWYHTDVTWDDQGGLANIYYAYLNVTTQQIRQDHALDSFYATYLPDCASTAANYFARTDTLAESFDVDQVAREMQANHLQARLYVTGDLNAFIQGYNDNIRALISKLGLKGQIGYGYRNLGRELTLYIQNGTTEAFPAGISLTALPGNTAWEGAVDVTGGSVNVYYSDGSVTSLAMSADMITGFDPAAEGTQVVTVTFDGCREYFTVYNTLPEPEVLPGDLDGDNIVTNDDVVRLLWHTLFPENTPIMGSGDLNGDEIITNDDVIKLLWHCLFPEENPL